MVEITLKREVKQGVDNRGSWWKQGAVDCLSVVLQNERCKENHSVPGQIKKKTISTLEQ